VLVRGRAGARRDVRLHSPPTIGGVLIAESIPFVVRYFVGGVWTFVALVPMMLLMMLVAVVTDRIWKPFHDAKRRVEGDLEAPP
jgi:hypothetical protein